MKIGVDTWSIHSQKWDDMQILEYYKRIGVEVVHFASVWLLKSQDEGYLRKRLPQELVVLQGGMGNVFAGNAAVAGDPVSALATLVPETVSAGQTKMDARTKARMQGYEGDSCGECGNYTLVRNGTCMKCNTCGATSGCS